MFKNKSHNSWPLWNRDSQISSVAASQPASPAIDLTQLGNGHSARIIELQGGHELVSRLESMGIIPGTIITRKTASLMKGPIVVEKGETQLAIGYGMAQGIIVESVDM